MSTQRSPYAFEVWRPKPYDPLEPGKAERIADISHLCITRSFAVRRNRADELTLSLNLRAAEEFAVTRFGRNGFATLFDEGRNEIRVRRNDRYLLGLQIGPTTQAIAAGSETLEVTGSSWFDHFANRFLTTADSLFFSGVDISQMLKALIEAGQDGEQGNILVTFGELATSRSASAEFKPYGQSIRDMIEEVSNWSDSVDFSFDHERRFRTYFPHQGTDRTNLHFWMGEGGNISSISMTADPTQIVNESINRGTGNGDSAQVIESVPNTGSRAYYGQKSRIDDFPAMGMGDIARLQANGAETARIHGRPMAIPDVVLDGSKAPPLGSYWVGDWVMFDIQNRPGFARIANRPWRINEFTVTIDQNDHEEVRLAVGIA